MYITSASPTKRSLGSVNGMAQLTGKSCMVSYALADVYIVSQRLSCGRSVLQRQHPCSLCPIARIFLAAALCMRCSWCWVVLP
jgi:hypothetical protein